MTLILGNINGKFYLTENMACNGKNGVVHTEEYTIFSSGNRHSFVSNLRLLALVYSHFYDLDMVTFSSLTNKQLRLMNFFSLELEDLQ